MRGLTERQEKVLKFIQRLVRRFERTPRYREIAAYLKVDVRAAYQHVQALERKGVLERTGGGIKLMPEYRPLPGLPVLGHVAAGSPILAIENLEEHIDLAAKFQDDNLFLLKVKGDSMKDAGILDGDLVLARSQLAVENGDIAVVLIGEEATVKRVKLGKDRIRLEPANRKYKAVTFSSGDEVRIAGKVLMAIREL